MEKKNDLPYFPFYFGDWMKSPEIRALDLNVRMIWFEMLGLMWESRERGYLTLNGKPVITPVISKMLGVDITELEQAISQLEEYNVFSRREDGAIYSRRMVRDEEKRLLKSLAGKKGMQNRYGSPVITPVTPAVITPVITKVLTNAENEIDIDIDNENEKEKEKKIKAEAKAKAETKSKAKSKAEINKNKIDSEKINSISDEIKNEGMAWYNYLHNTFKSSRTNILEVTSEVRVLTLAGMTLMQIQAIRLYLSRQPPANNGSFSWSRIITYPGRLLERKNNDERNPTYFEMILQEITAGAKSDNKIQETVRKAVEKYGGLPD
jgi:hypothetical protein